MEETITCCVCLAECQIKVYDLETDHCDLNQLSLISENDSLDRKSEKEICGYIHNGAK